MSVILTNKYVKQKDKMLLNREKAVEKRKRIIAILNILVNIALIINIVYLFTLNNNRGTIIVLIVFVFALLITKIKKLWNRVIFCFSLLFIGILLFNPIINLIANSNTNINWLERFAYQINNGDITSNRGVIYKKAIKYIEKEPIIGNGIGKFENENNRQYTHNIFIQLFCEFGLPMGIILSLIIIKYIFIITIKNKDTIKNKFLLYTMMESIPRLMMSSVYWVNSFFWIFMYYAIRKEIKIIKRRGKNVKRNSK